MPPPPPNSPLSYTAHPSLLPHYNIPVSIWIVREDSRLCVGIAVLHHQGLPPPRVLLLQRSPSESFSHRWELPGGGAESHEPNLLAAAARELYEEPACAQAPSPPTWGPTRGLTPTRTRGKWRKVSFIVEVEGGGGEEKLPEVVLDPEEHQAFVWATEDEVRVGRAGGVEFRWISEEQRADVLRAFELAKTKSGPESSIDSWVLLLQSLTITAFAPPTTIAASHHDPYLAHRHTVDHLRL
ncbi:hypothetical protein EDB81DRAFT_850199 [Dactylonectria macrodidyma]|uniref:Nudix hydrolase domain-containing protein n=1 Tax=Dactylonectria macrodidyma TaxID=307937 RepID=A0A9P9JJ39_9HYPO|nr:hypothetical protein EDB81DRAFT_850199 [Dactylonectria macrodidyma]